ncbi:hypothetical protein SEVIR_4G277720v4 [Setaria viridis]
MLKLKRPEIGTWNLNMAKDQGSSPREKVTFDMLLDKYTKEKAVTSDRPVKKGMRSPTHQGRQGSPPRAVIRQRGDQVQSRQYPSTFWAPPASKPSCPMWDDNGVMWVPYQFVQQPYFHPGWGESRKSALDRISRPLQGRWAPRSSGQGIQTQPIRPVYPNRSDRSVQAPTATPPKQVYHPKQREEEFQRMEVESGKGKEKYIIQIKAMEVPVETNAKGPIGTSNLVMSSSQKVPAANYHEASSSGSSSKYFLPRWCPPKLTRTQRRKLQRLRLQERREQELEK